MFNKNVPAQFSDLSNLPIDTVSLVFPSTFSSLLTTETKTFRSSEVFPAVNIRI